MVVIFGVLRDSYGFEIWYWGGCTCELEVSLLRR